MNTDLFPTVAAFDAVVADADKPSPENGGPCATCAFRVGTEANRSQHTVTLAKLCIAGITPFDCHERVGFCRGWIAAVNLTGVDDSEDGRIRQEAAREAAEILAECIDRAAAKQREACHV